MLEMQEINKFQENKNILHHFGIFKKKFWIAEKFIHFSWSWKFQENHRMTLHLEWHILEKFRISEKLMKFVRNIGLWPILENLEKFFELPKLILFLSTVLHFSNFSYNKWKNFSPIFWNVRKNSQKSFFTVKNCKNVVN